MCQVLEKIKERLIHIYKKEIHINGQKKNEIFNLMVPLIHFPLFSYGQ